MFWGAVWYTIFYTAVATVGKFLLGLWLALLLNHHLPFKAFIRAIVLLPWIVPTVLSSIAWWWIYDPQFSIISIVAGGCAASARPLLRLPRLALAGAVVADRRPTSGAVFRSWRSRLLAGLQTISPSLYEAALLDGATAWQKFRRITVPLLMPILSVALTLSVLFTFSDFQLVYAITRGGPFNSTHLMATLAFQRAIPGVQLGEGAAIAVSMIPFLLVATLVCFFGVGRRKWQQGATMTDAIGASPRKSKRASPPRPRMRRNPSGIRARAAPSRSTSRWPSS